MCFPSLLGWLSATAVSVLIFATGANAKTPQEVFMRASPSVVVITVLDSDGRAGALGSGVVIEANEVLTNCHVTNKGNRYQVSRNGKSFEGKLRYADRERDLCQLNVPGLDARAADIGLRKGLQVGQRVYAIGAPQGLELTISEGLISSLRDFGGVKLIQTTAAMSAGSSGGGLFDEEGTLVGITTFYVAQGQNLNFALPVEWIVDLPQRAQMQDTLVSRGQRTAVEWLNQFVILGEKEDWQGTLKLAQEYVRSDPESWIAWWQLFNAYRHLKQTEQFIAQAKAFLRRAPSRTDVWSLLGEAYADLGQRRDAVTAYQESVRLSPDNPHFWFSLGEAYARIGQMERAIDAYRQSIRAHQKITENIPASARKGLFIVSTFDPIWTWRALGDAYLKVKQVENAINAYEEAVSLAPSNAGSWAGLGRSYVTAKKYDKAVAAYEESVRLNPNDARSWLGLGISYHAYKQFAKAIDAYQVALSLKSEFDADIWYFLGSTYWVQGNRDKVREVYDVLRKLDATKAKEFFKDFILP